MKLAAVVSTPDVRNAPLALLSGSFEEKAAKAHSWGYSGVELMVRDPSSLDLGHLRSVLDKNCLDVVQIVTGELFGADRLCLVTPSTDILQKAQVRIRQIIQFAAAFQAYVNIGRFRGRLDSMESPSIGYSLAIERIGQVADWAADSGVKITIEPINRYETDFIRNTQEGLQFLKSLGRSNVGLMLDLFHMNIEDDSIENRLREAFAADVLWHVHIADSNRRYPGQGHIQFARVVQTLREAGYEGYLSAEMLPIPDGDTAAYETSHYMMPLL
jgi:sugar phosphate isomerase/epimerase